MKLTIIIVAYNEALYIRDCLESLDETIGARNDNRDFEVVIVDDASTDGTDVILRDWCAIRPFARMIRHEKNQGISAARNTGLGSAQGEYVAWIDADDTVERNWFSEIYMALESGADIIAFDERFVGHQKNYSDIRYGRDVLKMNAPEMVGLKDFADRVVTTFYVGGYCWNKVIRRARWCNGFDAPREAIEDLGALLMIFRKVTTVYYIPMPLINYHYRRNGFLAEFSETRQIVNYVYLKSKLQDAPEWLKPSVEYALCNYQVLVNRRRSDLRDFAILRRTLTRYLRDPLKSRHEKVARILDSFALTAFLHSTYIRWRRCVWKEPV